MMTTAVQSGYVTVRHLRNLARQPWWIAISLIQPIIWLLLFSALFKRVAELPGFGPSSYLEFLAPGVIVMSALFANGWAGMNVIEDIDRGVMDRFLVSPIRRSAILVGIVAREGITTTIQTLILLGLAVIAGARFGGGVLGVLVMIVATVLLGASIASLSNALALLLPRRESLIAVTQLVLLPMMFLSTGLMQQNMVPGWIRNVARFNPVNWAVEAGRGALAGGTDWPLVLSRCGFLLALAVVCAWLSTRAFRVYQRSV